MHTVTCLTVAHPLLQASRNGNTVVNLVSDSATAAPAKVTGRLNVIAGKSFLNCEIES